jgi:LCP family protein required for cell wall assembly
MSDERSGRRKSLRPIARHGRQRRRNPVGAIFKLLTGVLSVLLISTVAVGAVALSQVQSSIGGVVLENEVEGAPPPEIGSFEGGFNILIVGSDVRAGYSALNDVTMLVHVSADQTHVTAVSFPRDMVVPIPSCPRADGKGNYRSMSAQPINVTLSYGGLACTVMTVEKLTDLEIPYAGLITFGGVVEMSNAVGGVEVCVNGPVVDRKANGINLPKAGKYTISGVEALGFLRTRYGVGDGSDLGRISNQQVYLSSLVRKLKSEEVLTNPATLFSLATAASQNMELSTYLKNINTMVSMAQVLRKIDLEQVKFVQYPSTTGVGGVYLGKVAPIERKAAELFALIRADQPFSLVEGNTGRGSVLDPDAPIVEETSPADGTEASVLTGVFGQSAADHTCSKAN